MLRKRPFLLRFTAFSLAAMAVPVLGLKALEQFSGNAAELLARIAYVSSPLIEPVLKAAGVLTPSPVVGGIYLLFLLVYAQALIAMAKAAIARIKRNSLAYLAWGTFRRRDIGKWLVALGVCMAGMAGVHFAPAFAVTDLQTVLLACGRIAAFTGLALGSMLSAMLIAQQSMLARKSAAERETVQDNSPAIYVAFVAEMVQIIGREQRLPHPSELELSLSQLQEMTAQTHDHLFDHEALSPLCQVGLALFADGELKTLPNVQAALALYYRPDPGALFDVAAELQKRITNTESAENQPEEAFELLPLTPIKGPDGALT